MNYFVSRDVMAGMIEIHVLKSYALDAGVLLPVLVIVGLRTFNGHSHVTPDMPALLMPGGIMSNRRSEVAKQSSKLANTVRCTHVKRLPDEQL